MVKWVIQMRVFYLFKIKEVFKNLYQDDSYTLYRILKQIYNLDKSEIGYALTLLNQLEVKINKEKLDRDLFIRLHQKMPYSKRGEIHYINNLYKNEVSKLRVNHRYIKIETESSVSSFFDELRKLDQDFFVCDFKDKDFFWLDRVKTLV